MRDSPYLKNSAWLWLAILAMHLCVSGTAHAQAVASPEQWRSEIAAAGSLAENDAPLAYKEAQRLQASIPAAAVPSDKSQVLNLLARIELYLGLIKQAAEHSAQAKEIAKVNNDHAEQIRADLVISACAINQGRLDDMVAATKEGMDLLVGLKRDDLRAETMFYAAMMYLRFGQLEQAVAVAVQSLEIAKNSTDPLVVAYAEQGMATAYSQSALQDLAEEHYQRMLAAARQAHSTLLEAAALLGMSEKNLPDAEQQREQAIALFRRVGAPLYVSHALFMKANYYLQHKYPAKALSLLDEDVAIYQQYANPIGLWWTLIKRSQVLQAMGRLDAAHDDAERANGLAKKIGFTIYLAGSARRLADLFAAEGDFQQAYRWSAQAAQLNVKLEQEKFGSRILDLSKRFQEESKQRQIDELKQHNQIQDAQRRWLWAVLVGSIVVLAITIYFFARLRRSHRLWEASNTEVQRSQNKLQAMLDAIPDLLFVLGLDGRYYDYHSPRSDLLAAPAEALLGKTVFEIMPPEAADICMAALQEVHETGLSTGRQFELELSHGKFWFELSVARKQQVAGLEPRFIVLSRDISERKRAEELLHAREQEFRAMVENSPDIIARYDNQCRRIYVNPAMRRQFSLSVEEILGKTPLDFSVLHEAEAYVQRIQNVLKTGQEAGIEISFSDPQGGVHWGDMRLVPEFGPDGAVASVLAITRDISERMQVEVALRESEEKYRTLIQKIRAAVVVHGADTQILISNSVAQEILGLTEAQLQGKTALDPAWHFFHENGGIAQPDDYPANKVLASGKALRNYVLGVHRPNQKDDVWVLVNADPIFDKDGEIAQIIVSFIDITERKRYEMQESIRQRIFELLAQGGDITEILSLVVTYVEQGRPDLLTSIMLLDADGKHLLSSAAPSLPSDCVSAIHGITIGEGVDSCGTAAWRGETVIAEDLRSHPYWVPYTQLTSEAGLMACWSEPIFDSAGKILGSFGIYRREPGTPNDEEMLLVRRANHLAAIAIERKRDEETLIAREREFRTLAENQPDAIVRLDTKGRNLYINDSALRFTGLTEMEILGKTVCELPVPGNPELMRPLQDALFEVVVSMNPNSMEFTWPNGSISEVRHIPEVSEQGELISVLAVARDITERKQSEMLLHRLSRELKAISICNQILVRAENEKALLNEICKAVCDEVGYLMAWVGFAENAPAKTVSPVAQFGDETGYLDSINITWADDETGRGPTGTAIRTGLTVVNHDTQTNPDMKPWHKVAISHGYRSSVALPLFVDKHLLGALTIYSSEPHVFSHEEVALLEGLASDIAYGVQTLRTRAERGKAERLLEESRAQLRGLAARNESVREEERKYIAREVHDELGQILTGLQLDVSMLSYKFGSELPALREHLRGTLELVNKSLATTRNVATALRPGSLDMGIVAAIEWLVERFGKNTGINCRVHVRDEDRDIELGESASIALFRITQESLTNVARHAKASKIDISLGREGSYHILEVRDNGIGFDTDAVKKGSFGLVGIRERVLLLGGDILISSAPGKGTVIEVHMPV